LDPVYGAKVGREAYLAIADGTLQLPLGAPAPLALFRAARIDYSLHRLFHYTGTDPEHFQNLVVFTNYQFYIDAFAGICREYMANGHPPYGTFVAPGNVVMRNARFGATEPIGAPPARASDACLSSGWTGLRRDDHDQHRHGPFERA
jgi:AMP nucleosidase